MAGVRTSLSRRVLEPTRWFVVHVGAVLEEYLDRLGMTEERREAERVEAFLLVRLVDPDARLPEDRLQPAGIPDRRGLVEVQRVLRGPGEQQLDHLSRPVESGGQDERAVRGFHPEERRMAAEGVLGLLP